MKQQHSLKKLVSALAVASVCFFASAFLNPARGTDVTLREGVPQRLADTGLYDDMATGRINPRNRAFVPQYPLWSDGAQKSRWIHLPEGTQIDVSDRDRWRFPVGTKIWKEFSFSGRKVETRFIYQIEAGNWIFATYLWNDKQDEAQLAPENGVPAFFEIKPGVKHDIPGVRDCKSCHAGSGTPEILGFSELQLSTDRDPHAPHFEPLAPGAVTLKTLFDENLATPVVESWLVSPPRIYAVTPAARSALGYLHANCGQCHNADTNTGRLGMSLKHLSAVTSPIEEDAWKTTVGIKSRFQIPGVTPGESYRIKPGDPASSSIFTRMSTRNPYKQMPPLGTHCVDVEGSDALRAWIQEIE